MLSAGRLNRRLNIMARSSTQDAVGQPVESWSLVAAVWGDVRHQSGVETIKGNADASVVKASIRIRYRAGLDAGMRVELGATIYDIKALLPDGRRQFIDLICELAQ